jgi:membrane carboxypeptidase/penicillin-binding protein PbpC
VLLAWDKSYVLRAFAVPQKEYREAWTQINKAEKEFLVTLLGHEDRFLLKFPHSKPIDVTRYQGDFTVLQ